MRASSGIFALQDRLQLVHNLTGDLLANPAALRQISQALDARASAAVDDPSLSGIGAWGATPGQGVLTREFLDSGMGLLRMLGQLGLSSTGDQTMYSGSESHYRHRAQTSHMGVGSSEDSERPGEEIGLAHESGVECTGGQQASLVQPSGPRRPGEGMNDMAQDIIGIQTVGDHCTVMTVTLLVSGFIIGPGGVSIRAIQHNTGTQIMSWTQSVQGNAVRMFSVQGTELSQAWALTLMKNAVCRYKFLSEGQCQGQEVDQVQVISGIEFFYNPPPKSVVPQAASVKEDSSSDGPTVQHLHR